MESVGQVSYLCRGCGKQVTADSVSLWHDEGREAEICLYCIVGLQTFAGDFPAWVHYWFPLLRWVSEYPADHPVSQMVEREFSAEDQVETGGLGFFHGRKWLANDYPTPLFLHEYAHLMTPGAGHNNLFWVVERSLFREWGYGGTVDHPTGLYSHRGRMRLRPNRSRGFGEYYPLEPQVY